jgi:hypothetical protein
MIFQITGAKENIGRACAYLVSWGVSFSHSNGIIKTSKITDSMQHQAIIELLSRNTNVVVAKI